MTIDELLTLPTRRDRWGRYVVLPPGGSQPVGYTRATTIAKTLDDQQALIEWKARMVAIGIGARPDLAARAAVVDKEDRKALNALAEDAATAGGATIRRDQGTAMHAAFEASWHDLTAVPAMFAAEAKAVHGALSAAGLSVVEGMAERMVVNDAYKVAGTFDLVLTDGTDLYVADVKTGSSLMGALSFAIQLTLYATADNLYVQGAAADGSEDVREPMPDLSKSAGVILHIQPGSTTCDLHWIDLEAGAEALDLAMQVREMRKVKVLSKVGSLSEPSQKARDEQQAETVEKVKAAFPGAEELVGEVWRVWMRGRLGEIVAQGHKQALLQAWPVDVPKLAGGEDITDAQAILIEKACEEVEREHELSFPPPMPASIRRKSDVLKEVGDIDMKRWVSHVVQAPEALDEGREITTAETKPLKALQKSLSPEVQAWVGSITTSASRSKVSFRISGTAGRYTERRLAITEALLTVAELGQDIVTKLVETVRDEPLGKTSLGKAFGLLTIRQANRLTALGRAIDQGTVTPIFELDGGISLTGDLDQALAA